MKIIFLAMALSACTPAYVPPTANEIEQANNRTPEEIDAARKSLGAYVDKLERANEIRPITDRLDTIINQQRNQAIYKYRINKATANYLKSK